METSVNPDDENKGPAGLVETIKTYFIENYQPAKDPLIAEYHFTTLEIYNQLQRILPNKELFTPAEVALWLNDAGFIFYDFGEMHFEWLIGSKRN